MFVGLYERTDIYHGCEDAAYCPNACYTTLHVRVENPQPELRDKALPLCPRCPLWWRVYSATCSSVRTGTGNWRRNVHRETPEWSDQFLRAQRGHTNTP